MLKPTDYAQRETNLAWNFAATIEAYHENF